MRVELLRFTKNADELCGMAAAICYGGKNYKKSLIHAVRSGHESVLEHASFTFRIDGVSRSLLAQLTRHRIASFSVESQRYVKLDKCLETEIPESILESFPDDYENFIGYIHAFYNRLLDAGIPAEDARYILPNATVTKLILTMNARELRHFFSLRCCNRAQWEIRNLADTMLELCKEKAPMIFADAGAPCGKCPEINPCDNPRNA